VSHLIHTLERFLEWGGVKKAVTCLVFSGIALLVSIFDLLPQLQAYNPAITADLNRLADIVRADEAFLDDAAETLYGQLVLPEDVPALDKKRLLAQPLAMQRRLIRRLWQEATGSRQDLPFHYVETIRDLAAKGAGKQFQCGRACAYTTRTALCLGPAVPRRGRQG
jgi:tRNA(Ile)-lysidine synthase